MNGGIVTGRYHYTDNEIKAILHSAVVLCDTREQQNNHILKAFDAMNILHKPYKLDAGDYSVLLPANPEAGIYRDTYFDNDILIERKANLDELSGNFTANRERFKNEMIRAGSAQKHLVIEQGGDYAAILNHEYQSKLSERSFFASLLSFQSRYTLNVVFTEPTRTAEIIWGLLYYFVRSKLIERG